MVEKASKFEDLVIFQKALELCNLVYALTKNEPWKNDFRFVQQIHAAVGSVMDNIAEGFERDGNKEFIQFLYVAKGSCGEVRSQIIRAHSVGYLEDEIYKKSYSLCVNLSVAIANFIRSLRASEIKGQKYQEKESHRTVSKGFKHQPESIASVCLPPNETAALPHETAECKETAALPHETH